ncbi:MAG TPA: cupin domain-containing protein [Myxococcota bacterium]|nr:cupin domain-containing protein [Myxococcota bacterium]
MEALATVLKQLIAARQPTVLHRKARPMPPTWAFDLARAATERSLAGTPGARMRLYGNGQELPLSAELLPQPPDTHLAGWLDRVQLRDPGLILNNVQCLSPEVWRWVRQILGSIFEDHMPAGGCSLEIFTGRYPQSFFGLHKDDQDVVTFVLEGTKVFYVWPFEVFSALAPGLQPMGNHALPDVDWRQHLDLALRLEARPGDIVYWPAEAWHIAAADDPGLLTTTLGLGFFRGGNPAQLCADAVAAALTDGETPELPPFHRDAVAQGVDQILGFLAQPSVRERTEEQLLSWLTGYGFTTLPEPQEQTEVSPRFRAVAHGGISSLPRGAQRVVGACGRLFRIPEHPLLLDLLNALASGATLHRDAWQHDEVAPEVVDWLLLELLSVNAIEAA